MRSSWKYVLFVLVLSLFFAACSMLGSADKYTLSAGDINPSFGALDKENMLGEVVYSQINEPQYDGYIKTVAKLNCLCQLSESYARSSKILLRTSVAGALVSGDNSARVSKIVGNKPMGQWSDDELFAVAARLVGAAGSSVSDKQQYATTVENLDRLLISLKKAIMSIPQLTFTGTRLSEDIELLPSAKKTTATYEISRALINLNSISTKAPEIIQELEKLAGAFTLAARS